MVFRRVTKRLLPAMLGMALILPAVASRAQSPQKPIIFKMNHQFPADTTGSKLDAWFAERISTATGGQVRIRIFWSNGLGGPRENLALLQNGAIDMAAMSAGYFPAELPLYAAPNAIPMGMDNICQSSAIMHAFITRIGAFKKEADRYGIRPLFFHLLNPYLLVTKTPVTSFDQLKGIRIRTWGEDMPRLMTAAGATPVKLYLPDIYTAMEHGVIDACPFSVDLMKSYELHRLARHVTEVVLWEGPSWGIWISSQAWAKLPPAQRRIFSDTAEHVRRKEIPATLAAERKARIFLKAQGVQFHPFAPVELARWQTASPDFFQDLVARLEQRGQGAAGRQMVKLWQELRQQIVCP